MTGEIEFAWVRFGPVVNSGEHDSELSDGFHFPAQIRSRLFERVCVRVSVNSARPHTISPFVLHTAHGSNPRDLCHQFEMG